MNGQMNAIHLNKFGMTRYSTLNMETRGAAIFILKKGFPFKASTVIPDNNGRFIEVVGKMFDHYIIFAILYGRNWGKKFLILCLSFPTFYHILIWGCDFSCILDSALGKYDPRYGSKVSRSGKTILFCMQAYEHYDPWRHSNPTHLFFYSLVYCSYSRVAFYLIDHKARNINEYFQTHYINLNLPQVFVSTVKIHSF